jgi:hypothetical protein
MLANWSLFLCGSSALCEKASTQAYGDLLHVRLRGKPGYAAGLFVPGTVN